MKICPLCRTKFEDSAEFCPSCKAELSDYEEVQENNKLKIPKSFWWVIVGVCVFIVFIVVIVSLFYTGTAAS